MIFDREAFIRQALQYRKNGEERLRTTGIEIDEILVKELASPGTDARNGISLIARPTAQIKAEIRRIQEHLKEVEPGQYVYPAEDLHVTVVEVVFGRGLAEVNEVLGQMRGLVQGLLQELPVPVLEPFLLGFDPKGCALNFVPEDEKLQDLRNLLRERLEKAGIQVQARYGAASAHVSILRYVRPLRTETERWADILRDTRVDASLSWTLASLEVTAGANWYGKQGRGCTGEAEKI